MVLCHWRTGESFNWKGHKILSTRYDHFRECRKTNYKNYEAPFPFLFFINILVIISFCLSQCRKPNGRPSFNHMQRNSYSHTSKLAKSKDTNMPSSLAIWIAAWITSKLYIPYLITNHCNNRWISNCWMICFSEAMHYQ